MRQSWTNKLFRSLLVGRLVRLKHGRLTLVDGHHRQTFGEATANVEPVIVVKRERFYRRVVLGGSLGAAEALMDGDWECDDLVGLVRLFIRNEGISNGLDRGWAWLTQSVARLNQWRRRNTPVNSRQNIHEHYDLGNDFFRLFLDDTLNYSCGVFTQPAATMRDASLAKMELACAKLDLKPSDHLLEIGTGWGALAIHSASKFGCRVTTSTISPEQHRLAGDRVRREGLLDRVSLLCDDYRDLQGKFSKLVSIEMIEAVGHRFLNTYLAKCSQLLRPDGVMLLQAIVIRDQAFDTHRKSVDFIGKYIFPGGFLPSVSAITDGLKQASDLRVLHLEEMSPHYVRTLQDWRQKFWRNIEAVRELGFDEHFVRMWDYYLCYCEAAFAERQVNVVQMLLAKPNYRGGWPPEHANFAADVSWSNPVGRGSEEWAHGRCGVEATT